MSNSENCAQYSYMLYSELDYVHTSPFGCLFATSKGPGSGQLRFCSIAEQPNQASGKVLVDENIPTTIKSYVAASAMPSPD
jgi:hypothetical protein